MERLWLISLLSLVLLLHSPDVRAERESPFVFQETTIDFGSIKEADGPVSGIFYFRNRSDKAVQIDFVATSCGCTTADYPVRPVEPGQICEIAVSFNPANMSGKVYRDVTVVTKNSEDRLVIKADVEPIPVGPEKVYPSVVGGEIRSRDLSYRFGYAAQGRSQSQSITLYNGGDKTVLLTAKSDNPLLTVRCPYSLKAGAADGMTVTYTVPAGEEYYGISNDEITLYIDGVKAPNSIKLSAIMVDDLDKNDKSAPSMRITPTFINLKGVRAGKTSKTECTIYNDGKSDLVIKYLKASSNVSTSLKTGVKIAPGKSLKVEIKFTSPKNTSASEGSIYFITNDPLRPQKEILIRANT